jgi:hypothetical protein
VNLEPEPFFDADKCAKAALTAAVGLRRTAWEHRRRGDMAGYRKLVDSAVWHRRKGREWREEANA